MRTKPGDKVGTLTITEVKRVRRGHRVTAVCDCGELVTDTLSQFTKKHRGTCRSNKCKDRSQLGNGRRITTDGYIAVRVNGKEKLEHRLAVAKHIGRDLTDNEIIHHINGNKTDNRIENLSIFDNRTHSKHHREIAKELLKLRDENKKLRERIAALTN